MIAKVRGQFTDFTGALTVAENPARSTAEVIIQTASVTTHDDRRDAHLRSTDFLDADRYPTMIFRSTGVLAGATSGFTVLGEISIKECTRPVQLDVELNGVATDPWGQQRIAFSATTEIDRDHFGITFNAPLDDGGFLVARTVKIEIEIEAIRQIS
jgi:polyisoprenoid-binding protein YceI